jgi:hypothetical protein
LVTASDWAAIGNSTTAIMIISHRAAAAAWIDQQFRLIESALPWLERAGTAVEDGCWLSRDGVSGLRPTHRSTSRSS